MYYSYKMTAVLFCSVQSVPVLKLSKICEFLEVPKLITVKVAEFLYIFQTKA